MTIRALAKALRRRQLRARLQPKKLIHALPDADIIACYTECSQCRQSLFATPESERMAMALADDAEHFAQLCTEALRAHDCPAEPRARN